MLYTQPRIHPEKWDAQTSLGFEIQTDQLISARRPDLVRVSIKKRVYWIGEFAVPVDHWIKLKESEKKDKYLDLAKELKKLWNIKMMVIPIVTGALSTVTKGLIKGLEDLEIRGQMETIQMTVFLKSNTKKSSGDLKRLAVTQTPMRNHLLTLVWRTLIIIIIIIIINLR